MKIHRWFFLLCVISLVSCEKAIDFSPRNPESKLVVEGIIESGQYPVVYLSRSLSFFNKVTLEELAGSFVRNAEITISNGSTTCRLTEHELQVADGYAIYYYTADSLDQSSFRGEEGNSYELTIELDGQTYTAGTTIPHLARTIDSLYYEKNVDDEDSSKVVLYGKFTDPPGYGNYSRYYTSVNHGPYRPGFASVFDDQVIDGTSYKVQIEQGIDRNSDVDFEEYAYFHKGDIISVKFCNIDKGVFDFWRTMEFSYSSIGNPFSSPTRIIGNVSNGALGYFGGYAVQYANIVIQE